MSETEKQSSKNPAEHLFALWSAYAAELNGIGAHLSQSIENAQGEYMRSSQSALTDPDAQTKLQDAWKAYGQALEDLQKKLGLEDRFQKAYETYLHALKAFFAKVDVGDLTPALLSWVANSMLWAAYWRSCGSGRWCIAGSWGWNPNYVLFSRWGPLPENPEVSRAA